MNALSPLDRLSRRRFVNSGIASLLIPAVVARAQNNTPGASPHPAASPLEPAKIAVDKDTADHLTIKVTLNDRGPYRFVVDTGADRSVIADDVAVSLGLLRQKEVMVEGVVRTIPARTVRLDNISFGPVSHDSLDVPVLPRSLLDADGYLGLDVIDGYKVTMDFKNHALEVRHPSPELLSDWTASRDIKVHVLGQSGHLRAVDCRADGIRATAFIDTGAEYSVGNSKLFDALMEANPVYLRPELIPLTGITGGIVEGHIATINRVDLNSLYMMGCNFIIADLQIFRLWGLSDTPALLIGMNFLRQFSKVSIDYGSKELRFELARLLVAKRG